MPRIQTPEEIQTYLQLVDWIEHSIQNAKKVLRGEQPLDQNAYEELYSALVDLADWYRIDVIYD